MVTAGVLHHRLAHAERQAATARRHARSTRRLRRPSCRGPSAASVRRWRRYDSRGDRPPRVPLGLLRGSRSGSSS
jgi:hypothetical protein